MYGILSDTHLLYKNGENNLREEIDTTNLQNVYQFLSLALRHKLRQVWIQPQAQLTERILTQEEGFLLRTTNSPYNVRQEELTACTTLGKRTRHKHKQDTDIHIILTACLEDIPEFLQESTDDLPLYNYVGHLQTLLRIPFTRDAKGTGIALLESFYRFRELWLHNVDMSPFYRKRQVDRQWARELTRQEKYSYKYLHTIDLNTMYLSVTKDLLVGKGTCEFQGPTPFDPSRSGLWWVKIQENTLFEAKGYPQIFPSPSHQPTELIDMAVTLGYKIEILGSYTFPQTWKLFAPWYVVLEEALESEKQKGTQEYSSKPFIKKLCNQMLGLMAREQAVDEKTKWYNRPDIYNSVVGASIAKMYATMHHLVMADLPLVMLDVDTLAFLSNVPLEESLPVTIKLSDKIGDFRHTGSYPVEAITDACSPSPLTLKKRLKELSHAS